MIATAQNTITTIFGATISGVISNTNPLTPTLHDWTADSTGLFQTTTNLAAEWQSDYQTMLAGNGASLTDIQRLEGNAEAVFENTCLAKLGAAAQAIDREDVQREFDAIAAAMTLDGVSDTQPLTEQSYLQIGQTIQDSPTLEELAMQGHGLNNSGISRYNGYTNDFQNNVDTTTLFIGGGTLNNNTNALANFFDDNVLSHLPFAVVSRDGKLVQLNQNGAPENQLNQAIVALNDSMVYRTYTSADFSSTPATAATNKADNAVFYTNEDKGFIAALAVADAAPAPSGMVKTLFGGAVSNTIAIAVGPVDHLWTAGSDGLYHTTTNLAAEWRSDYVALVTNGGPGLSAEQRLEANAEAVFENTGLAKLPAAQQEAYREDAQREFDAIFQAMSDAGIDPNAPITAASYLAVEQALRSNAPLEQLALEGRGLNDPASSDFDGFTNDFQNTVDNTTLYVGGGLDNGQLAIADFFANAVMSNLPFPTVVVNGQLVQLNQNGGWANTESVAAAGYNRTVHVAIDSAGSFRQATTS